MTDIARAMYKFWNSFDIPAHVEYQVPVTAELPYITYTLGSNDFKDNGLQQVRVWYKTSSMVSINAKLDDITSRIGEGIRLPLPNGNIIIYKGTPLVQFQPSDDPSLKIAYCNFEVSYLTN